MDRNRLVAGFRSTLGGSLSARRAWIEIPITSPTTNCFKSLSARRAWIEMLASRLVDMSAASLSARRAWIEIMDDLEPSSTRKCRSPQGERG